VTVGRILGRVVGGCRCDRRGCLSSGGEAGCRWLWDVVVVGLDVVFIVVVCVPSS
jgi:hypothetical protein